MGKVNLQMYSFMDGTMNDSRENFRRAAEMGYDGAELFGMDSVLFVSDKRLAEPMDGVKSTYTLESGTYREFMGILPGLLSL